MTRVFMWINTVLISMVLGAPHTSAQSLTPWSGDTQMPDFNGEIYTIQTAEELAWIASASRTDDFAGKTVRLAADLDLGGNGATPSSSGRVRRRQPCDLQSIYTLFAPPRRCRVDCRKRKRGGYSPFGYRARADHDGCSE